MTKPKWEITQISAGEAEEILRKKLTGSLTVHYSQGTPVSYEWKQKVKESTIDNRVNPVQGRKFSLTGIPAT